MMKKKYSFKQIINTLHLWVGVPSALILFLVCLTGTLYVFQKEITKWVDSEKYTVTVPASAKALSLDSLVKLTELQNKELKVTVALVPEQKNEVWQFTIAPLPKMDSDKAKAEVRKKTRTLLINPYTGLAQGDTKSACTQFFAKVIELHRWMLLDHSIGSIITVISAFLFLFLEISGIILWMPAKLKQWKKWKSWKQGFSIKRKAGWKRVNHDLHKTLGFYSFFFITIMAITGPYFAFDWYRNVFAGALGTKPLKKEMTNNAKSTKQKMVLKTISIDNLLVQANQILPYPGEIRINLPKTPGANLSLQKSKTGFYAFAGTDKIDFSGEDGNVKKVELFSQKRFGEKIIAVVRAIHTGEIFGTLSKILYFLACFIATSLPITGIFIWLNKRKKKKKKSVALSLVSDF